MSERLTKRLPNGGVMYDNGEYHAVCYPWEEHCLCSVDRMAIKLCELEDKIEQGNVVEVVRCKDCKHCEQYPLYKEKGKESKFEYICCAFGNVSLDFYCGIGERREE